MPIDAELRNVFQVRVARQDEGGGFLAPATNSGKAICAVADHGEVVGDGCGWYAELRDYSGFIANNFLASIKLDYAGSNNGLTQIFVSRANENLFDALVLGGFCGGGGESVIGFEICLGPDEYPHCLQTFFDDRE